MDNERFWKRLLILGILLNVLVVFTSDLGLDTHLRMAADSETGDLPWGDTRPTDPMASDPANTGNIDPYLLSSTMSFWLVSLITLAMTLALIGFIYKYLGLRYAAIVAIYPTIIFATGRGYQETIIALCALFSALSLCVANQQKDEPETPPLVPLVLAVVGGIVFMQIPAMKGVIDDYQVIGYGVVLGLVAHLRSKIANIQGPHYDLIRNPLAVSAITGGATALAFLLLGLSSKGGTISIISAEPGRYLFALIISFIDVILIYMIFGMALWPFVGSITSKLKETRDYTIATLMGFISIFSVAITIYVAALWTYEASIWEAQWPGVMWIMGNNGRYISLLIGPIMLLIYRLNKLHPDMPTFENPRGKAKSLMIALMFILPISLFTAANGQTMWTDEAGEYLSQNMGDGEDFLFVHESTLGMHWLYTFHVEVDPDDERGITGHWRSPLSGWEDELADGEKMENRGNISQLSWIVFSPGLVWQQPLDGWSKETHGDADFLNGGGVWEIWKKNSSI